MLEEEKSDYTWNESTYSKDVAELYQSGTLEDDRKCQRFLLASCSDVYKCFTCHNTSTNELVMMILAWWLPENKAVHIECMARYTGCKVSFNEMFQSWLVFVKKTEWPQIRAIIMEAYEWQLPELLKTEMGWKDSGLSFTSTKSRVAKTWLLVQLYDVTSTELTQAPAITQKVWEEWNKFIGFWFSRKLVWNEDDQEIE